jgi:hypothetical protein
MLREGAAARHRQSRRWTGALRSRIRIPGCAARTAWHRADGDISNIIGDASIEPEYQNIYVKSNLSGEFTVVNKSRHQLKKLNLWDEVMVADLKYFDGSLAKIDRVPADLATSTLPRSKSTPNGSSRPARDREWIDRAQSLSIMAGASGKLDETYKLAWVRGLETTYYLRTSRHAGREVHAKAASSMPYRARALSWVLWVPRSPRARRAALRRRRQMWPSLRSSTARSTIRRAKPASDVRPNARRSSIP